MNEEMIEEIEKVPEEKQEVNEVEQASEKFTKGLRLFKSMASNTKSRKSLLRVLNAVAEFPLASEQPRLLNDQERNLFYLFQELVQNKSVILTHFLHERFKKGDDNNGEQKE